FGVVSFSSDWLFPPEQSRHIVEGLSRAGRRVSYLEITSNCGHDAFLLPDEIDQYGAFVQAILEPGPEKSSSSRKGTDDLRHSPTSVFHAHRLDHEIILDLIPAEASVLDLGCGE